MSAGEFHDVAHVVSSSSIARAVGRVAEIASAAAAHSTIFASFNRRGRRIAASPAVTRVRLAGVLLLTATVTHAVLLLLIPAFVRPAVLQLFRAEVVVASLIFVGAAPWIAHAWQGSRVRRIFGA